jgi:serine protein kinase
MDIERSTFEKIIREDRANRESKAWRGTLLDYLEKIKEDPMMTKLAHARL